MTLMRLKQTESKLNFKVQLLEKEIEELKLAAVKERKVRIIKTPVVLNFQGQLNNVTQQKMFFPVDIFDFYDHTRES